MTTKIYVLCETSGKIRYVGKTVKSLDKRLGYHLYEAKKGTRNHRCNWIRSLLSKGFLPSLQLIGKVEGNGCKEEIAWIKYFREEGCALVNQTDGGEGVTGRMCSTETRAKISAAIKGHKVLPETRAKISALCKGERHPLWGKHRSLEVRTKISTKHKGERNWNFGKHSSLETRAKMSAARKGRICIPETRTKISMANKGKKRSLDAREKMSVAAKKGWIARKTEMQKLKVSSTSLSV